MNIEMSGPGTSGLPHGIAVVAGADELALYQIFTYIELLPEVENAIRA